MISWMELPRNRLTYITVMNTATWGVFKAYAFLVFHYCWAWSNVRFSWYVFKYTQTSGRLCVALCPLLPYIVSLHNNFFHGDKIILSLTNYKILIIIPTLPCWVIDRPLIQNRRYRGGRAELQNIGTGRVW